MKIFLLSSLLVLLTIISFAQQGYVITGKIKEVDNSKIYLTEFVINGKRDSAIIQNGTFRFTGTLSNPMPVVIRLANKPQSYFLFFAENAAIGLTVDTAAMDQSKVTGSATHKEYEDYDNGLKPLNAALTALSNRRRGRPKDDQQLADSISRAWEAIEDQRKALAKSWINQHPNSIVSAYSITRFFLTQPDLAELEGLYKTLTPAVQQTSFGKEIAGRIDIEKKTGIGQVAADFTQNDTLGKPVSLKDFRGQYVLLDFWASWCGPCRLENPNVVAAYKKFKDKNFTVLSVSLDGPGKKEAWLNAIHKDGLTWTHVSDLQFWNNAVSRQYGINAIPSNFLIDPDGKIVGKNLNGEKLHEKLISVLDKKETPAADQAAINALKKEVEAAPDSLSSHKEYIKAVGIDDPALMAQYEEWLKKYPQKVSIPFAIGSALYNHEYPTAKPWLLKAVALDPKLAEAYLMLSIDAERWGDKAVARDYMGKAAAADPENPSYAFYYAMDFEHVDPARWRAKLYELTKRFPTNERGAQGLYWLATRTTDAKEKREVYEQLRRLYPPAKFNWSESGMNHLFDLYLSTAPAKARELSKSMGSKGGWGAKDTLAQNIIAVRRLMAEKKFMEAHLILKEIRLPRYSGSVETIALLRAEAADGAGGSTVAYDSLLSLHAKKPSDELYAALKKYGAKSGKNISQVEEDIASLREKSSTPAPAFNLGLYTSNGTAALEDYKGKVVLLTFWFPGCGPCRGEFPHFENVLKKFNRNKVAYLAINPITEQDDYVVPFVKGTKYTFTPLRATMEWAEKTYKVRGMPTNFVIDPQGRIVFSHFMAHDARTERMLELMISSLLPRS